MIYCFLALLPFKPFIHPFIDSSIHSFMHRCCSSLCLSCPVQQFKTLVPRLPDLPIGVFTKTGGTVETFLCFIGNGMAWFTIGFILICTQTWYATSHVMSRPMACCHVVMPHVLMFPSDGISLPYCIRWNFVDLGNCRLFFLHFSSRPSSTNISFA